jgi:hypothetical protein
MVGFCKERKLFSHNALPLLSKMISSYKQSVKCPIEHNLSFGQKLSELEESDRKPDIILGLDLMLKFSQVRNFTLLRATGEKGWGGDLWGYLCIVELSSPLKQLLSPSIYPHTSQNQLCS